MQVYQHELFTVLSSLKLTHPQAHQSLISAMYDTVKAAQKEPDEKAAV